VEATLERLLRERKKLIARVDALDADIRVEKEKRREELLRELAVLGVPDAMARRRPAGGIRETPRIKREQACRVCGFKTTPPHDTRSHRRQTAKQPFSDAELAGKNLARA
jgi:hypothetical protein